MADSPLEIHERRIQVLEKEISEKGQELSSTRRKYIDEFPAFLLKEYDDKLSWTIKHNPDVAQMLGLEGLRPMKGEVAKLKTRVPEIVKTHIDIDNIWLPTGAIKNANSVPPPDEAVRHFKDGVDKALRRAVGQLGDILVKYKFAKVEVHGEWQKENSDGVVYGHGFIYPPSIIAINASYEKLLREYYRLLSDAASARIAKKEVEAKNLWDQA